MRSFAIRLFLRVISLATAAALTAAPALAGADWGTGERAAARVVAMAEAARCEEADPLCLLGKRSLLKSGFQDVLTFGAGAGLDTDWSDIQAHGKPFMGLDAPLTRRLAALTPPVLAEALGAATPSDDIDALIERDIALAANPRCPRRWQVCVLGELAVLVEADQTARSVPNCEALAGPPREACGIAKGRRMARIDTVSRQRLEAIVRRVGWIDGLSWGENGEDDAWLIVQHADRDPAFQRRMLALMQRSVDAGRSGRSNYALLIDRVAVNAGEPQTYGTQGYCEGEGAQAHWIARPLRAPEKLEDLRRAMVLGAFAGYQAMMNRICRGQPPNG